MTPASACPEEPLLRQFLEERLPAADHGSISLHLGTCRSCTARLAALAGTADAALDLTHEGAILEPDIDAVENECELHQRKRRDAEALCTVARNANGPCLDLGTSHGRSAFKLATNVGPKHTVYTVNMLERGGIRVSKITHWAVKYGFVFLLYL